LRLIQAKVRSTIHRLGNTTKLCSSLRSTISMIHLPVAAAAAAAQWLSAELYTCLSKLSLFRWPLIVFSPAIQALASRSNTGVRPERGEAVSLPNDSQS
jgi:hypothetical protein